jgi:hypothetical protein
MPYVGEVGDMGGLSLEALEVEAPRITNVRARRRKDATAPAEQ